MNCTEQRARVCVAHGEMPRVLLDGRELSGIVRSAAEHPVTGDWVIVRLVEPELVLIEQVLPRRSRIARRAAGRREEEQVLAANVDLALIVCGLDGDFNVRRLERYLAICKDGGVTPAIVLNKADTCLETAAALEQARRAALSGAVLAISAKTGDGCEAIHAMLEPGVTAVLLGSSGAGKSTLLNRLLGADLRKTAPVRESDSRGRHTTTVRELIELPNGAAVIDTPGLREIQLWAGRESVAAVFEDIAALASQCRFRDCSHTVEPGCAVRPAVEAGRLESFHKLRREADRVEGLLTEKQRWRSIHKAVRQLYKLRDREIR